MMQNIDFYTASKLAEEVIHCESLSDGYECAFMPEHTKEIKHGWVFFYQSKTFLQSKNFSDMLVGNCPIFVTRKGEIHRLPTHMSWEKAVEKIYFKKSSI